MKRISAKNRRTIASAVMTPLSARGVPVHVRDQILLVRVNARMAVDLLAGAVVVGGGREGLGRSPRTLGDLQVRVAVGRVGEGELGEELLGGTIRVVGVHTEEGDLVSPLLGQGLEPGKLEPARAAPRGPLVDDHWDAVQLRQAGVEGVRAPAEQLVALGANLRELWRRPLQGLSRLLLR